MNPKICTILITCLNIYKVFNILYIENIDLYKQKCYSHGWKSFTDNNFTLFLEKYVNLKHLKNYFLKYRNVNIFSNYDFYGILL